MIHNSGPTNRIHRDAAPSSDTPEGAMGLYWLPSFPDWLEKMDVFEESGATPHERWLMLQQLASTRLGILRTVRLSRAYTSFEGLTDITGVTGEPIRLAIMGSGTVSHLLPGINVAAVRRGLQIQSYVSEYGQYFRHLGTDELNQFQPNAILFAFDPEHLLGRDQSSVVDEESANTLIITAIERLKKLWSTAKRLYGCIIIQQTFLPTFPCLMGQNERRLVWSLPALIDRLNEEIRKLADASDISLLDMDNRVREDGILAWHDTRSWYHSRQEIRPYAVPFYGDLVVRLLAASVGRSKKCLVLDLDNTLWGGVIGDDGIEGIVLGQGDALGEAYSSFQRYVKNLSRRGIVLAICSKNDHENAMLPFTKHPDMVLNRSDIACFCANWRDKATNLRTIASELNLGLDSIVFVDDNPVEREFVRQALPNVAVPEVGHDPYEFMRLISDAGYFESVSITDDDLQRTRQYASNHSRIELKKNSLSVKEYIRGLNMEMHWSHIDGINIKRVHQLINKTNQFNLTSKRYSEEEILHLVNSNEYITIQFRLLDRFGDNGLVSVVIIRLLTNEEAQIDTWLMSCRVLGRDVEKGVMNTIIYRLQRAGVNLVRGIYKPNGRNSMVENHYLNLGFHPTGEENIFELDVKRASVQEIDLLVEEK